MTGVVVVMEDAVEVVEVADDLMMDEEVVAASMMVAGAEVKKP